MILTPGERLGPYEVQAPLGAGGMGEVYRAKDVRLGRTVAIKVIKNERADPVRLERFWREARAASQLNHPNILTVHDIQETAAGPCLVMEHIEGESLQARLRAGRLDVAEAVAIAAQIAGALSAAHRAGIVHRDLKPGNVMVAPEGRVKVVDFGLAKLLDPPAESPEADTRTVAPALTDPRGRMGTPQYMSPEQAAGDPAGPASDIFSFGLMLYEMLAGVRPFEADSKAGALRKLLTEDPRPIASGAPNVPAELAAVLTKCLEKNPAARYANGEELLAALAGLPAPGTRIAPPALDTRPKSRGPAIAAVAVLAGLAILLAFPWLRARLPGSKPAAAPVVAVQRGVAVLPFTALDGQERTRAFALGLVMAASASLSDWEPFRKAFWVVPMPDVLQARAQSAKEANQLFNVDLVVSGSVEARDGQVRIIANVNDARTLRQLRSRQITRPARDLLSIQDELSRAVGELLELDLSPVERMGVAAGGSSRPEAQDFYLQGRGYLQSGPDKVTFAIGVFEQALRIDPDFRRAHAGLAEAFLQKYQQTREPSWIAKARLSAETAGPIPEGLLVLGAIEREQGKLDSAAGRLQKALTVDQGNREAWIRLAQVYEAQARIGDAESAYKKAIQIAPGYPAGHSGAGAFYYRRGRYAEAEREFLTARELAPDNYRVYNSLGGLYIQRGQYDQAERVLRQSLALRPNALAYNNLSVVYFLQERYRESIEPLEKAIEMGLANVTLFGNLGRVYRLVPGFEAKAPPVYAKAYELAEKQLKVNPRNAEVHADLAILRAETGDRERARKEIAAALAFGPADPAVLFRLVMAHEMLGDRDSALAAYGSLARTGTYLEEIRRRPELKAFRADPRFQKTANKEK